MNKITKRIALGLVMALSIGVLAGCGNNEKIGYVNLAKVQEDSAKYAELQNRIVAKQQDIVKRLQEAQEKDTKEQFDVELKKSQEEMQIFQLAMQREFKSNVDAAVADVARNKELTIVVNKYAELNGGEDITEAVLDKMGRKKADAAPAANGNTKKEESAKGADTNK